MAGVSTTGPASGRRGPEVRSAKIQASSISELPQILDLTYANSLRDILTALMGGGSAVILDAAAVERMSTPCAQVLLAAGRAFASSGQSCRILNASGVFRTALVDLGLERAFSEWMD
jgi:anti-anti-sigma regulatory factor